MSDRPTLDVLAQNLKGLPFLDADPPPGWWDHCLNNGSAICPSELTTQADETHVIEEMGMKQSLVNPCVFHKESEELVVLVAVTHVCNMALGGSPEWTKWFKEGLKKRFGTTDLRILKKHLGIWHEWKNNKNGEWCIVATVSKLVQQSIECTEKAVGHGVKNSSVPAAPGSCLEKNVEEDETIMETECCSIVGKSMHLVAKLFVEGWNPVRELAKCFSNPGIGHWKAVEKFAGCLKVNKHEIKLTHREPKEL
jgi:hypothetical protein